MDGIGIIGVGNMGSALLRGLIRSEKASADQITVFDTDRSKTEPLREEFGIAIAPRESETIQSDTEILVLAVKPQIMGPVLDSIRGKIHESPLVISIAAGLTTGFILSHLDGAARVVRVMPNAAAMVGESASALCKAGQADDDDMAKALDIFSAFGVAVAVEEKMMNTVTALSGSGPGYVFAILEALVDGAVCMGMDRPTARTLAIQTVLGAARMAAAEEAPFSELKDRITSPGGTTIAGLHVLERAGLRGILMDVIEEATARGEELGAGK